MGKLTRRVQFTAPADHYDRFMGRYVPTLAVALADAAGVQPGMRALDVGCGPGGLTRELAARLGADHVAAVDPAEQFADACRARNPGADVRVGAAEALPFEDDSFDAALSSLVVAFMRDAAAGAREMARVTRPGGVVASCMWDIPGGGMTMLSTFWRAVQTVDPGAEGEQTRVGVRDGEIAEFLARRRARGRADRLARHLRPLRGLRRLLGAVHVRGRAGRRLHQQAVGGQAGRDPPTRCFSLLGEPGGAFDLDAHAWYARGTVPG